ncbi:unnamed protein product [Prorocentrum cordatum]|uniref:Uncharacterized protein n=1 Tax=Prorocentrum cordatum TaxID=2364126 RepID=A0ABN9PAF8_9DINO|nr:unnamed protein product [Polarella glacialis]
MLLPGCPHLVSHKSRALLCCVCASTLANALLALLYRMPLRAFSSTPPASVLGGPPKSAVAVFVQMANPSVWPHLRECVTNVREGATCTSRQGARLTRNVDVYIGMISGSNNSSIAEDARLLVHRWNMGGEYQARLIMNFSLENKGADVGLFLQQIQQVLDPSMYEFLLKVHSKRAEAWRCQMLTSLCGSKDQVKHISKVVSHGGPTKLIAAASSSKRRSGVLGCPRWCRPVAWGGPLSASCEEEAAGRSM